MNRRNWVASIMGLFAGSAFKEQPDSISKLADESPLYCITIPDCLPFNEITRIHDDWARLDCGRLIILEHGVRIRKLDPQPDLTALIGKRVKLNVGEGTVLAAFVATEEFESKKVTYAQIVVELDRGGLVQCPIDHWSVEVVP